MQIWSGALLPLYSDHTDIHIMQTYSSLPTQTTVMAKYVWYLLIMLLVKTLDLRWHGSKQTLDIINTNDLIFRLEQIVKYIFFLKKKCPFWRTANILRRLSSLDLKDCNAAVGIHLPLPQAHLQINLNSLNAKKKTTPAHISQNAHTNMQSKNTRLEICTIHKWLKYKSEQIKKPSE